MLRLDSIALLDSAIKSLPSLSNNLAPGAPHTYVLALQIDKLLHLHSIGLEKIYSRIAIRSTDTLDGQAFMWPLADLKLILEQLESSYSIQIASQVGATELTTYVEVIDNQIQNLDTCFLPAFGGSFDEFTLGLLENKIATFTTSGSSTLETLNRTVTYGDYKSRAGGDRAVLLTVAASTLVTYAIPQTAPNFYLAQQLKVISTDLKDSQSVIVLGCHLAEITSFFADRDLETLEWNLYPDCLQVISNNKQKELRLPLQDIDRFSYLKPIAASFNGDLGQLVSSYALPLTRMIAGTKAQQAPRSNNRFIKLTPGNQQIKLGKVSDILEREQSLVEVYKAIEQQTIPKITINGPAFLKSLQVLEAFLKKTELTANLELKFWQKTLGIRSRWIMQIQLEPSLMQIESVVNILAGINVEM
jgi:hypothetical protein